MVELLDGLLAAGEVAVEADDVAVARLHPDAAEEAAILTLSADGEDVEDGGGGAAEEVVADEGEGVVLAVEAVRVHQDHLHEAGLTEGEAQAAGDAVEGAEGVLEEAQFALLGGEVAFVILVGVVVDDLAEVDARQEVLIGLGDLEQDRIGLHVLDVGLHQRRALLDHLDDFLLAQDRLVDQGILRGGELAPRHGVLGRGLLLAEDDGPGRGRRGRGEKECQQGCTGGGS